MAAEATFKSGAVDATKAAFASVQNGLDKLSASAGRSGAALARGVDIRHAMTSVAVAIGVSVDKIATGIARLITGVSEEQEKLFNELGTVSDAAFSSQEQLLKSRRSDEEQLAYLLNQRASIEKKLVSDSASGTQ